MSDGEGIDIPITGDSSGLVDAFVRAADAGAEMGDKINDGVEKIADKFKEMGSEVLKMATAFVAAQVGVEALKKAFDDVAEGMEHARQIALDSAAIGATAEQYQRLAAVAHEFGVGGEAMTMSLERLNVALGKAASEGGAAADKFTALGLDVAKLKGMNPEERFKTIADAIKNMGDRTAQTEAAVSLFGRSGLRLVNVLAEGREGFTGIADEAKAAGVILSEFQIGKVSELARQAKEVEEKMEAAKVAIAEGLGGAITQIQGQWADNALAIRKNTDAFEDFGAALVGASAMLGDMGIAATILWDRFKEGIALLVLRFMGGLVKLATALDETVQWIVAKWEQTWAAIKAGWSVVEDVVQGVWLGIKKAVGDALQAIVNVFASSIETMADALTFLPGTDEMVAGIRGFAEKTRGFGKDIAGDVTEAMNTATDKVVSDSKIMSSSVAAIFTTKPMFDTTAEDAALDRINLGLERVLADCNKTQDAADKLKTPWETAQSAVEKYRASIEKANAAGRKAAEDAAKNGNGGPTSTYSGVSSADAQKYLAAIQASTNAALILGQSAAVKEEAEYADRLTKFGEFYREKGLIASDGEQALEKLNQEHALRMESAENTAAMNEYKADAKNNQLSFEQRQIALNNLTRVENAASTAALTNLMKEHDREMMLTRENEAKDSLAGRKSLIDYDAQRIEITNKYETQKALIEKNIGVQSVAEQRSLDQQKVSSNQQAMSMVGNILGQAAALMNQHSRAGFMAWKVFATSQATVNAFLAYSQVLSSMDPASCFGGAPFRMAMANITLGLGLANAAKIASTPFGGGGGGSGGTSSMGGGGGTPTTGAAAAQAMNPAQTNVNVSLYGSSFGADQVRGLIGLINQQQSQNMVIQVKN